MDLVRHFLHRSCIIRFSSTWQPRMYMRGSNRQLKMTTDPTPTPDRSHLLTEQRLPESMKLDVTAIADAVNLMLDQDRRAVEAVAAQKQAITRAIEIVSSAQKSGGRLIYVGAGTSGRLGVLDAAECPPTFRSEPDMVQGIIAGGDAAMFR